MCSLIACDMLTRALRQENPCTWGTHLKEKTMWAETYSAGGCVCVCESISHVRLLATPWTVAHPAPLSMGFSRQKH